MFVSELLGNTVAPRLMDTPLYYRHLNTMDKFLGPDCFPINIYTTPP